jgi:hypothetical protein
VALIGKSDFDSTLIDDACRRAGQPTWERIKLLCQAAEDETEPDPEHAHQAAHRLINQASPLLAVLDRLLPPGHSLRERAQDEVALRVLACQVAYANKTQDWKASQGMLQETLRFGLSESTRSRIQGELETVSQNLESAVCWFCRSNPRDDHSAIDIPMYGQVMRVPVYNGYQVRWQNFTLKVPRCGPCKTAHRRRDAYTLLGGFLGGLLGLGGCTGVTAVTGAWFPALFLISVGILAGGGAFGSLLMLKKYTAGVRPESHKNHYPALETMKKRGWKVGTRPAGV